MFSFTRHLIYETFMNWDKCMLTLSDAEKAVNLLEYFYLRALDHGGTQAIVEWKLFLDCAKFCATTLANDSNIVDR